MMAKITQLAMLVAVAGALLACGGKSENGGGNGSRAGSNVRTVVSPGNHDVPMKIVMTTKFEIVERHDDGMAVVRIDGPRKGICRLRLRGDGVNLPIDQFIAKVKFDGSKLSINQIGEGRDLRLILEHLIRRWEMSVADHLAIHGGSVEEIEFEAQP